MSRFAVVRSIVLTLLVCLPSTASAAVTWTKRFPSDSSTIWGIVSVTSSSDGSYISGVDPRDTAIYTSSNFGAGWATRSAPDSMPSEIDDIASSADGTKLVLSICSKYIYTSTNGGATWTTRTSAGARHWQGIASSADGTRLAAVENPGYIYTSADSGATWTQRTGAGSRNWYTIASSADGMKLAAGSIDGSIYTSVDGGATWTQRTGAGNWYWQSIASSADGMALAAVGNNPGYVYTSTDGGATWTQRTGAGSRNWRSIASSADGTKLAAVAGGNTLYTSADGGATWTTQTAPTTSGLMGVWFLTVASSADGNKLVVGSGVLYGSIWTVDLGYTPPASCTVTLTPNPVNQGASSTLSWSASNADTSVYIENVGYMSGSSGSFSVTRSSTTDYSCYASGAGGSDGWHEATLTVLQSCAWDGGSVTNGQSVTAYQASTVPYGSSCVSQTRTCSDGTLSGTYAYASCEVSHQACTQDGATIEHGESHTFYLSQVGAPCSSVSQSRTCTDGTLSGSPSYQYASCTCAPLYSCSGSDITYTDASCTTTTVRSCTAPYFCSPGSSSCISPEPVFNAGNGRTGHLQVQPQLVPKGLTTTVYWDVANVQSCTVTGDNGDSWTGLTGAKTSSPISSQTRYTLSCTPLEGASFPTETQQVNVVPVFQEV